MKKNTAKQVKDSKVKTKEESKNSSKSKTEKVKHKTLSKHVIKLEEDKKTPKKSDLKKIIEGLHSESEDLQKVIEAPKIEKIEQKKSDSTLKKHQVEQKAELTDDIAQEKHAELEEVHSLKEMKEKILEVFEEKISSPPPKPTDSLIENKSRVEAILFASGKYVEEETLSSLCEIDKKTVKKALEELRKDYDSKQTSLMINQEGTKWKINVREKYLSLVRKIVADTELTKTVMETLAVIAWKTPIYQSEIVRIRGNKCYDHIEELETAGFISKDKKGRSFVLKTTDKFYNYFDIDKKNLQGVMNEAKMPVIQQKLGEEEKTEEVPLNPIDKIKNIETKSVVRTEEEKIAEREFLNSIHSKIETSAKRTDEYVSEIPKPMHEQENSNQTSENNGALNTEFVQEKGDDIVIETNIDPEHHEFQKPQEQIQKPKSLTKKQLEKKFKEELQRVKDKGK